ncbi:MAG: serine/threonine protein kinase [Lachnospiraceae bacterium]|nr:serine/threonine protein kinase [Lachnospiraceae bacterium]
MNSIKIIDCISDSDRNKVYLIEGESEPCILKIVRNANLNVYERISKLQDKHIPKVLDSEAMSLKEARTKVNNDEIYSYVDENESVLMLLEEYVDGDPLDKYVKEHDISEDAIVSLILQVLSTVERLHSLEPSIIHRDLKPDNILVDSTGNVMIVDFDISREEKSDDKKTSDTMHLGTKRYAPPEQYGFSRTDPRSDIYSIGVILYELLYKKKFDKNNFKESLNNARVNVFESASVVHPELVRIIKKCTEFAPDKRFDNTAQLIKRLKGYKSANGKRIFLYTLVGVVAAFCVITVGKNNMANKSAFGSGKKLMQEVVSNGDSSSGSSEVTEENTDESSGASSETSDILNPADIDDTDKEAFSPDDINPETGLRDTPTIFFMPDNPELTPVYIANERLKNVEISNIRLLDMVNTKMSFVNFDYVDYNAEDGVVSLAPEAFEGLDEEKQYKLIIDTGELLFYIYVELVDSYDKISEFGSKPHLFVNSLEYLRNDPIDIKCYITNLYGRKITKLVDYETKEVISPDLYEVDEEKNILTFKKEYFEDKENGVWINILVHYKKDKKLLHNDPGIISVVPREHEYISPVILKESFTLKKAKDVVVELEWNDGWGHLDGIYTIDEGGIDIDRKYYTYDENSITIDKKFIKKLKKKGKGKYHYILEFVDVAKKITLNIM